MCPIKKLRPLCEAEEKGGSEKRIALAVQKRKWNIGVIKDRIRREDLGDW
jgi:hypothetical protein